MTALETAAACYAALVAAADVLRTDEADQAACDAADHLLELAALAPAGSK